MRILLQHVRTQLYLRRLGSWTTNSLEAFDFRHSQRAIDFARKHALPGVQIAVQYSDRACDEVYPLATRVAALSPHARTQLPMRVA